ncbi:MAG: hypothetical protein K2K86_05870, partial [Muribaculaceae bacterium]|nr:hypothetical protein [Muribaculaceae bacterium]
MDKNTLIGLLLMAGVIFGFMYLQPKNDPARQAQQRQEQIDKQNKAAEEAERAALLDSIRPDEIANLANTIAAVGVADADASAYTYATTGITLVNRDGVVSGTVMVPGATVDYAAVATSQYPDSLTLEQKQAAVRTLRDAMLNAAKYQTFARHLAGTDTVVTLKNKVLNLNIST